MNNGTDARITRLMDTQSQRVATLYRLAQTASREDPYRFEDYYGRVKIVIEPGTDPGFPDGVDIWIHPHPSVLADRKRYYLHFPIVEEFAEHRSAILMEAARKTITLPNVLDQLEQIHVNFNQRLLTLSTSYTNRSLERRSQCAQERSVIKRSQLIDLDKQEFHEKSAAIRRCLDKLHEDLVLLVAQSLHPTQGPCTRNDLINAAKQLEAHELTAYPPLVCRDILHIEEGEETGSSKQPNSWHFFDRHYHAPTLPNDNARYSINSHDIATDEIANFARTTYGTIKNVEGSQDNEIEFNAKIFCGRYSSPVRLGRYLADPPPSRHRLRAETLDVVRKVFLEDLALLDKKPDSLHHFHTHLITAAGVGSRLDRQREMFEDCSLVSMIFRNSRSIKGSNTALTYSYCSFGVNQFRRGQSQDLLLQNNIALLDLYHAVMNAFDLSSINAAYPRNTKQYYDNGLRACHYAACAYGEAIADWLKQTTEIIGPTEDLANQEHLDNLYAAYKKQEDLIRVYAKTLMDEIKKFLLGDRVKAELQDLYSKRLEPHSRSSRAYYALASLKLIFELSESNFGDDSWAHTDLNGVIQALIQTTASCSGIFSTYGCKNANDRSLLIGIHLTNLNALMETQQELNLDTLRALTRKVHLMHSQDSGVLQTLKDTGAPPKFVYQKPEETRGLRKLLKYKRYARHSASKTVLNAIKKKPEQDLNRLNFLSASSEYSSANLLAGGLDEKTYIETLLTAKFSSEHKKESLRILFQFYPAKKSFSHSRQAQVEQIQNAIKDTNFDDSESVKSLIQLLWIHHELINTKHSQLAYYLEVAIIGLLGNSVNLHPRLDYPELLTMKPSKFRKFVTMSGALDSSFLQRTNNSSQAMTTISKNICSLPYKLSCFSRKPTLFIQQGLDGIGQLFRAEPGEFDQSKSEEHEVDHSGDETELRLLGTTVGNQ